MRLTAHRKEILELLRHADGTRTAAAVHQALPHINLVTVYRALDYLVEKGLIKKMYLEGEEAQFELQETPHHHAICTDCGKIIHFTTDDEALRQEFALPGFVVTELEVTLRGHCRAHLRK